MSNYLNVQLNLFFLFKDKNSTKNTQVLIQTNKNDFTNSLTNTLLLVVN